MKLDTIRKILAAMRVMETLPISKSPPTAGRIATRAGLPRITAYRYLPKMETLGLVTSVFIPSKIGVFSMTDKAFHITVKSIEFLDAYKELF